MQPPRASIAPRLRHIPSRLERGSTWDCWSGRRAESTLRLLAFERAARAKADAIEGPFLLAETLASRGRRQEAERWAREALRRSPNDARAQQLLERVRK